ncbi:DNA-binding domain-containing protein [Nitratireductor luteus]|uniref:HvfC/BufC N-terminal domain-containing protein n=1 Tax=Nitratireductor luteus TaxID=2976980 RepID=UPI00223F8CDF|nr:DNA-binding domain-containing protein [Nitratireductor luteus]
MQSTSHRGDGAPAAARSYGAAFSAAILDPDQPKPDRITGPRGKAADKRFNVYRNNVTYSLVTALAEIFPAVARLLGEHNFRLVARDFLRAHPPRSRMVIEYGHEFAGFLAKLEPVRHLKYLPDLARLERAWLDAYHAADAAPLAPEEVGTLPPEALAGACFISHPAARIVRSRYAIHALFTANRGGEMPERIDAGEPESVLITRPNLQVKVYKLAPGQFSFIEALMSGRNLQAAAEAAIGNTPSFDLAPAIGLLIESGAFHACMGAERNAGGKQKG